MRPVMRPVLLLITHNYIAVAAMKAEEEEGDFLYRRSFTLALTLAVLAVCVFWCSQRCRQ